MDLKSRVIKVVKQTENKYLNLYEFQAKRRNGKVAPYFVSSRATDVEQLKAVSDTVQFIRGKFMLLNFCAHKIYAVATVQVFNKKTSSFSEYFGMNTAGASVFRWNPQRTLRISSDSYFRSRHTRGNHLAHRLAVEFKTKTKCFSLQQAHCQSLRLIFSYLASEY